jgi:hypothetical protein
VNPMVRVIAIPIVGPFAPTSPHSLWIGLYAGHPVASHPIFICGIPSRRGLLAALLIGGIPSRASSAPLMRVSFPPYLLFLVDTQFAARPQATRPHRAFVVLLKNSVVAGFDMPHLVHNFVSCKGSSAMRTSPSLWLGPRGVSSTVAARFI